MCRNVVREWMTKYLAFNVFRNRTNRCFNKCIKSYSSYGLPHFLIIALPVVEMSKAYDNNIIKSTLRWSQCQKYYYGNSAIQFYNNSVCLPLHICCLDLLPTAITRSVSRPSKSVSATEAAVHTVPRAKNATGNETMWTQVTCTQRKHNIIYSSRCLLYDWRVLAPKYGHFYSDL